MGHGRIISGADSSARLSGSHPPLPGSTGERLPGMDSAALPGPARSPQCACDQAACIQSIGHLLQARDPGSAVATPAQNLCVPAEFPPSVTACSPSAVAQTQVHSHVLFHAAMLCESETRCPAPRHSGHMPTPAHPRMGWVSRSLRAQVCVQMVGGEGGLMIQREEGAADAEGSSEGKEGKV